MTLSTFSYTIGMIELLVGVPLLMYPDATIAWFLNAMKQDVLIRSLGVVFLLICFFVLKEDASIGTDIGGLVRLVAWLGALKSLILAWFPERLLAVSERWLQHRALRASAGVVKCIAGILFLLAASALERQGL